MNAATCRPDCPKTKIEIWKQSQGLSPRQAYLSMFFIGKPKNPPDWGKSKFEAARLLYSSLAASWTGSSSWGLSDFLLPELRGANEVLLFFRLPFPVPDEAVEDEESPLLLDFRSRDPPLSILGKFLTPAVFLAGPNLGSMDLVGLLVGLSGARILLVGEPYSLIKTGLSRGT